MCRVFEHLAKSFCVHGVLFGPSLMEEHLRYITLYNLYNAKSCYFKGCSYLRRSDMDRSGTVWFKTGASQ